MEKNDKAVVHPSLEAEGFEPCEPLVRPRRNPVSAGVDYMARHPEVAAVRIPRARINLVSYRTNAKTWAGRLGLDIRTRTDKDFLYLERKGGNGTGA